MNSDNLLQELIGQHYWKMYLKLYGNLGKKKEDESNVIQIHGDSESSGAIHALL